ncbi:Facilitated trehalose transporter Tret1-2 homolog [Eumeta japonica]|uniref:Facilitated trehalose transporter Tret1-2 homolog n=1 Tax=Eumeta variegata TaxID=151549 RepID=A0A4C1SRX8_EUMVA|nr:Facilitated trehalose transporter Tret1-2 homolog [Eumeta japonica]
MRRNFDFAQIWTVFGALLNIAACGFHLGYPTVLFRDLRATDSPIPLTLAAESWITSSIAITTLLSFVLVAPLMERYGRKIAHLSLVISNILAGTTFYFAHNLATLVAARLIFGISNGGTVIVSAIIIAEFTSPKIRGVLLNAKTSSIVFGAGYAHSLGLFFDWRTIALMGLLLPVSSLLINLTWPESPAWLARRGHYERCKKNFDWLRGVDPNAQKELHALMQAEMDRRTGKISEVGPKSLPQKTKKFFMRFTHRDFLKPMWIMANVFIILEACGRHVFPTYGIRIVTALAGGQSTLYYVVGLDLVIFATSVLACVVVHMFKRRTLLFSTGTSPIILTLLGEIFPLKHRSIGVVMSGIFYATALMIALKMTPMLIEAIEFGSHRQKIIDRRGGGKNIRERRQTGSLPDYHRRSCVYSWTSANQIARAGAVLYRQHICVSEHTKHKGATRRSRPDAWTPETQRRRNLRHDMIPEQLDHEGLPIEKENKESDINYIFETVKQMN